VGLLHLAMQWSYSILD